MTRTVLRGRTSSDYGDASRSLGDCHRGRDCCGLVLPDQGADRVAVVERAVFLVRDFIRLIYAILTPTP